MGWKNIRLELSSSAGFPRGSAARAYLFRLPLDAHGVIDPIALASNPGQATVRRFWGSEPDQSGLIESAACELFFRLTPTGPGFLFRLQGMAFSLTEKATIRELDGTNNSFRIASVTSPTGVVLP